MGAPSFGVLGGAPRLLADLARAEELVLVHPGPDLQHIQHKAVQDRFAARPWPVDSLDLETEARPALSRVSREIVERAAAITKERAAGGSDSDEATLTLGLDPSWSDPPTRLAIARAIVALRVADVHGPTFVKARQLR